jgi:hypothetical protein
VAEVQFLKKETKKARKKRRALKPGEAPKVDINHVSSVRESFRDHQEGIKTGETTRFSAS